MTQAVPQNAVQNTVALKAQARKCYAQARKLGVQGKLVEQYLPLVKHVVSRIMVGLPASIVRDDLLSAGALGLVKASREFDSSREVDFKTYAYIRIRGAVIDELRSQAFVPPKVHTRVRAVQQAYNDLVTEGVPRPTEEQLAQKTGLTVTQVLNALTGARMQTFMSLNALGGDSEPALLEGLVSTGAAGPTEGMERAEVRERLANALRDLPDRERIAVLLYYYEDLSMKEVGKVLGVSESRVSQLHSTALFRLSMKMKGAVDDG